MPDEAYARLIGEDGKQVNANQLKAYVDNIIKTYSTKALRVGITDASQVEKAKLHEFGTRDIIEFTEDDIIYTLKGVPTRSFIRMPLSLFLPAALEQNKEAISRYRSSKAVENIMNLIGDSCVEVIRDAFDTQGFGQWLDHQNIEYKLLNDNPVLDKTGKLKNSIGYEIVDREVS